MEKTDAPLVSIVMPSLNVGHYIRECLTSVQRQTLDDIEIISVDAGSDDGTREIIAEGAKSDKRIRCLDSPCKSYGMQVNIGIRAAIGRYIAILDTDDYVPDDMYEKLTESAEAMQADFVKADFYRFVGEGASRSFARVRLAAELQLEKLYGKLLDAKRTPEIFRMRMNTWSGIYRRDYLIHYGIWHNESPGAAYQDNGFWFQTLMHARRACFLPEAYYCNRRDNAASSVYRRDQAESILQEFRYIHEKIQEHTGCERFLPQFGYALYQGVKGMLQRVAGTEAEKTFLCKASLELQRYARQGAFLADMFLPTEWEQLQQMIRSPSELFNMRENARKELQHWMEAVGAIMLYGAGIIGRQILRELLGLEAGDRVEGFVVTGKEENLSSIDGYPVYAVGDIPEQLKICGIIIAVTPKYQDAIKENLRRYQVPEQHIYMVPACLT